MSQLALAIVVPLLRQLSLTLFCFNGINLIVFAGKVSSKNMKSRDRGPWPNFAYYLMYAIHTPSRQQLGSLSYIMQIITCSCAV
jgi:hypothetical protein